MRIQVLTCILMMSNENKTNPKIEMKTAKEISLCETGCFEVLAQSTVKRVGQKNGFSSKDISTKYISGEILEQA